MSYISWHYGAGLNDARLKATLAVRSVYNYFSINELFGSLFAPYHRDLPPKRLGFDPQVFLYSIAESLVSRVVGFIIRTGIIFIGIFSIFFTVIGAFLFYLGWIVAPVSPVFFILTGLVMLF